MATCDAPCVTEKNLVCITQHAHNSSKQHHCTHNRGSVDLTYNGSSAGKRIQESSRQPYWVEVSSFALVDLPQTCWAKFLNTDTQARVVFVSLQYTSCLFKVGIGARRNAHRGIWLQPDPCRLSPWTCGGDASELWLSFVLRCPCMR